MNDPIGTEPLLVLEKAAKRFGAVRALEDGSVALYPGEAHALLGENGAGKSTLVKILAGVHQPDSGRLLIDGRPVVLSGPAASRAAGVSIIYQEPTLFPDLTVAENIFMGRRPLGAARRIDRPAMNRPPPRSSPGSASSSTRNARPAACRSPTSRSSRSRRRSRSTPRCW
jgi:rhamnose transport system ATP-binding protein